MNYKAAEKYILTKLQRELDPRLTYHSVYHTMDVLESAMRIAKMEGVNDEEMIVLKTACLFHDTGMLKTYRGHEAASVEICHIILPKYGYSKDIIDVVTSMIRTTELPQSAMNLLDMILCDADLDYLGRRDYFMISHKLKYEWEVLGVHKTSLLEWYGIQKSFLENHRYFTDSACDSRKEGKMENLHQVELILNH